jgi:hypothetical protein
MYAQAILPNDFNPFAPMGAPVPAPRRARRTAHNVRKDLAAARPTVVRALEVASWLVAPLGLAAFLLVH